MSFNLDIPPELPAQRQPDLRDITRLITTTGTAPTDTPRNAFEQIRLVVAGGIASLYVYDVSNNKWRAASLGT